MAHYLQPLINPASIAVVGATRRQHSVGNEVLVNLLRGGYRGQLFAVNAGYDEVLGVPCLPTLADLPTTVEQVIFAVADSRIEEALEQAISHGVKAVTIFSALTLADDTQPALVERVRQRARDAGVLLAGGNGMGFFNFRERVWAGGFDTRDHPHIGGVVLLSQSGAGMSGILDCEERLDFLFAASTGQELLVGVEDYLDYVLGLPETRVIGLFLETSRQPRKLQAALARARAANIPVVVLKVGRTPMAAELAVSHSGALAGSDASYQAVFDRYGVQRVRDMEELATALIMFSQAPDLASGDLVTLHDSGGERQLLIDLAAEHGVPLAPLRAATRQRLEQLLDPGLPAVNPLDAWGGGGSDADRVMAECLAAMLADETAACAAVVHDRAPGGTIYPQYVAYMERAREVARKPVFLVAARQGTGADPQVVATTRRGMPVLDGVSAFLVGMRCLLGWRDAGLRREEVAPDIPASVLSHWHTRLTGPVDERTAAALLADTGLPMNTYQSISSCEQCQQLAASLSYPVVLKTAVAGLAHKSDQGGVRLAIDSAAGLLDAYGEMSGRLGAAAVVAPMVTQPGVEMLLGISRDAQFGPMVVLGFGGVQAELLGDSVVLQPPFSAGTARRAIDQLKMRPLLDGVRGAAAVDIDAYCEMAARLSVLAVAFADEISELDINPVLVMARGCIGLDALLVADDSRCQTQGAGISEDASDPTQQDCTGDRT